MSEQFYNVVVSATINDLVSQVNILATQGWIPQGGIAVYRNPNQVDLFCQAVYRPRSSYGYQEPFIRLAAIGD